MNLLENTMGGTLVQADSTFENVQSFAQLHDRMLALLRQRRGYIDRPRRTTVVFGPVAAMNGRTTADNLRAIADASRKLAQEGWVVIDYASFEDVMLRLGRQNSLNEASTPRQIAEYLIEHFTEPLMRSGYLNAVHFVPNWRESHGATREHELAEQAGLDVVEITP